MSTNEILTLIAVIVGPVTAVAITLWVDGRRRDREQKIIVLRLLLATRHLPADPSFLAAINLIPVEFSERRDVIKAYNEFIEATKPRLDGINDETIIRNSSTKLTRLVYEISLSLGFKLRETDIQTSAYASDGWIRRDNLAQDSQQAMRDIANILWLQTRLLSGETWEQIQASKNDAPSAESNGISAAKEEKE
ncbi:DUF6680 family protein [Sphingopyxis witflariensis]|uniref:DUF6680 domain-containing protein n=1 Tax=Sphingopyxis witflariensis TaxID=173675 RepID=A0A246JQP7_9SPHN|nr:DUF6680 family protein [Sphingopyxis witflariensis]OWQ95334.1 hypothetical protein CDQ91_13685 [Sphingopyxis witflariensis]